MNERTQQLIVESAKLLATRPDEVTVKFHDGRYRIDAAACDLGSIMGKGSKHVKAIEYLAQSIDPRAQLFVSSGNRDQNGNGNSERHPDVGIRTDWSRDEENALRTRIESVLRYIYPAASAVSRPAVRESVYTVPGSHVLPDVVAACHVLFHAWGRRHGRYVTITCSIE